MLLVPRYEWMIRSSDMDGMNSNFILYYNVIMFSSTHHQFGK